MVKKVVFLDMDGVIVDLGTNINNWFNKHPATPTFFSFRYRFFYKLGKWYFRISEYIFLISDSERIIFILLIISLAILSSAGLL